MASQALNQFKEQARTPFLLRDILPGSAWASIQAEAELFSPLTDANCIKGFLASIALEGVAGFSVFALWQAWHLMSR
jgi:hypothetical protein